MQARFRLRTLPANGIMRISINITKDLYLCIIHLGRNPQRFPAIFFSVSKASRDNKFNAIKESAYFAYFDRKIGIRTILAMRKMKNGGPYKPYAIIDQYAFENNVSELQKGTPLQWPCLPYQTGLSI